MRVAYCIAHNAALLTTCSPERCPRRDARPRRVDMLGIIARSMDTAVSVEAVFKFCLIPYWLQLAAHLTGLHDKT